MSAGDDTTPPAVPRVVYDPLTHTVLIDMESDCGWSDFTGHVLSHQIELRYADQHAESEDTPPTTITVTLPAAEHDIDGEDEHGRWTQNPGWETRGIESGLISAWAQGVSIEDVLHDADDGGVIELEETARKVLAAIAWHRHFARSAAGAPTTDGGDPDA